MPVAAIATVAGASVVGGAISASTQAKAAKQAANAQVAASDQATALQGAIYNDQRNLLAPDIQAGAQAKARQMLMEGYTKDQVKAYLNSTSAAVNSPTPGISGTSISGGGIPNAAASTSTNPIDTSWVDSYTGYGPSDPSYQFRFDQGARAVQRSAAAKGDLFSGQTGQALNDYGQGSASTEFGADYARLGGLAGDGQTATGNTVNVSGNYGNAAASNAIGAGNARASGYISAGNAWSNFAGNTVPGALGSAYGIGKQSRWFGG